ERPREPLCRYQCFAIGEERRVPAPCSRMSLWSLWSLWPIMLLMRTRIHIFSILTIANQQHDDTIPLDHDTHAQIRRFHKRPPTMSSGLEAVAAFLRGAPEANVRALLETDEEFDENTPLEKLAICGSLLRAAPIEWVWPGRIPVGFLTALLGPGGIGKS